MLNNDNGLVFILCILSFLVGAIPSGYLLAKWYGITDIRTVGSGNIGASNLGRALGWKAFVIVFSLDALKAAAILLYAQTYNLSNEWLIIIAFATLLGNCFSPFLGFNGGKGVATLIGVVGVFSPFVMFCAVAIWLLILALTHIPAIASLCTLSTLPFLSYLFMPFYLIPFLIVASLIVFWRHKKNLQLLDA
jgi:acyl phosphate:glycerol-3-phosphate acyltransferase